MTKMAMWTFLELAEHQLLLGLVVLLLSLLHLFRKKLHLDDDLYGRQASIKLLLVLCGQKRKRSRHNGERNVQWSKPTQPAAKLDWDSEVALRDRVAYCGIANATVVSKVFEISRAQVSLLWSGAAGAFLLAQFVGMCAGELFARCREKVDYCITTLKFDETKHNIAHKSKRRWCTARKGKKAADQGWPVLVTIMNQKWKTLRGNHCELPIVVPPCIMYGKTAEHINQAYLRPVYLAIKRAIDVVCQFTLLCFMVYEMDSACSNKRYVAYMLDEQLREGYIVFWIWCSQHPNHAIQGTALA